MKVKLPKEAIRFIESNATKINEEWYYMPYWWKRIDGDVFEQVMFENLPNGLKKQIQKMREDINVG